MTENLVNVMYLAIATLVVPLKLLLFALHNWLTNRDYSYSLEELCDVGITACVCVWI